MSAFATETTESTMTEAFEQLPDNAIVCYMFGQPVYKHEVREDGFVDKDFNLGQNARISGSGATIPSNCRGKVITATATLTTTGYSQSEQALYLPYANAIEMASDAESASSNASLVSMVSGALGLATAPFAPYVSAASGTVSLLVSIYGFSRSTFAGEIREHTDAGDNVVIDYVNSAYGRFYTVSSWDGLRCVKEGYTYDETTVTVHSVYWAEGSVWG